ncbi:Di-copper centre-containing protein [Conidiobolus coronatus NRRL 28638]|uniref:Di-copper centre-containing protein n=1 Tax=Conidiobolus coronatus (strain ATCC 28846 / CBS 209.66 / NRRL 28638) TaxID=796925 RepID=A0A137P4I7_CONC2|nr:Di-copper centre-containing protein [Conidiobolus coronatus NRRL 28638]|eukprot:KXN69928.1 Di-copper centre-containing protein [Conidiobolus coronatus NRRL 28638]
MKSFGAFFTSFISLLAIGANAQDNCPRLRARPNVNKMSQDSWNRYVNAVRQLNSGSRPNKWDQLANMHVQYYDQVHSHPLFLGWHRQFLYDLESALRQIDETVRLPYWDWSVNYSNINVDPVWGKYGKNGDNGNSDCVMQGSFGGMGVAYGSGTLRNGEKCSTRRNQFDNVISGSKPELEGLIDSSNDHDFWENFEYGSHGRFHNGIGYDFAGHASPSDPLFYAHHAFIDKIWFDRQNRHPEFTLTYPDVPLNTRLPGYNNVQIWQTLDPFSMCYTYIPDNFSWDNVRTSSVLPDVQVEQFSPIQLSPSVSSTNVTKVNEIKDEHAKDFVFKNAVAPNLNNAPQQGSDGCEIYPIPAPVSSEYIAHMGYSEPKVREIERKNALQLTELNKRCMAA